MRPTPFSVLASLPPSDDSQVHPTIARRWAGVKAMLGAKDRRPEPFGHDALRHTFATDPLRDAGNVELVRRALGHANLATTQIYVHLVDADLEAALKSFRRTEAVAA